MESALIRSLMVLGMYHHYMGNVSKCCIARIKRGAGDPDTPSMENHNTGPDPLENYRAAKPAFNVGTLSPHQRNSI